MLRGRPVGVQDRRAAPGDLSPRERVFWAAVKRALLMLVAAIDSYIGKESPGSAGGVRYSEKRGRRPALGPGGRTRPDSAARVTREHLARAPVGRSAAC